MSVKIRFELLTVYWFHSRCKLVLILQCNITVGFAQHLLSALSLGFFKKFCNYLMYGAVFFRFDIVN